MLNCDDPQTLFVTSGYFTVAKISRMTYIARLPKRCSSPVLRCSSELPVTPPLRGWECHDGISLARVNIIDPPQSGLQVYQ